AHRRADPQVIPVCTVDDVLVLQLGVAARNHGSDIARVQWPDLRRNVAAHLYAELDRPEVSALARLQQVVEIPAGQRQKLFAGVARDPALERERLRPGLQLHERGFPAPGVAHHVPTVARRLRGVNDDARLGPAAQCLFIYTTETPSYGWD